ncbi:MAG TPA: PEFG-CTERM sorting domain-containing protein [Candidatus Nitrosotalea sp.]|nr:PEFG-CTERM sorting domain-containing protein [Candidatus Nitrosotalea sp.]
MLKVIFFVALALVVSPLVLSSNAFADFNATTGTYFCNAHDLSIEKSGYSYFIYQEDRYWGGERPQDIAATILKTSYSSTMLDNLGKSYQCLKENNVDPDSVARIPPYLLEGLNLAKEQNPEKFAQIAPSFSQYVPVPEFGTIASMIVAISIIGAIIISKRISN